MHGFHYDFINSDTIEHLSHDELKQQFIEYTRIHGNFYGTSLESIKKIHDSGKLCLLDIDAHGVKQIKQSHIQCRYIFIAPPSFEELETRLRG